MKDLTTGPEGKLILNFAVPMLIGNVFQQSYSMVDSVIVGRAIGKTALAAVGASFPILFLLIALSIGVTMGFSILISQYFGAKHMGKVQRAIDALARIPGIGPDTAGLLVRNGFLTLEGVLAAEAADLGAIEGIDAAGIKWPLGPF